MLRVEEVLRMGTLLEESTAVPIEELKMYLPSRLSAETDKNINLALKQVLIAFPHLFIT